jgi:hypothetical protein
VDGVKDPIMPHLSGKKTAKDMWEALVKRPHYTSFVWQEDSKGHVGGPDKVVPI